MSEWWEINACKINTVIFSTLFSISTRHRGLCTIFCFNFFLSSPLISDSDSHTCKNNVSFRIKTVSLYFSNQFNIYVYDALKWWNLFAIVTHWFHLSVVFVVVLVVLAINCFLGYFSTYYLYKYTGRIRL